jgi:hypothetical protein
MLPVDSSLEADVPLLELATWMERGRVVSVVSLVVQNRGAFALLCGQVQNRQVQHLNGDACLCKTLKEPRSID